VHTTCCCSDWLEQAVELLEAVAVHRLQRLPDGSGLLELEPETYGRIQELLERYQEWRYGGTSAA